MPVHSDRYGIDQYLSKYVDSDTVGVILPVYTTTVDFRSNS